MKKLVCLAAAVMMIGSVSVGAVTKPFVSAFLPQWRKAVSVAFANLPSPSSSGIFQLDKAAGVPIYVGFYKDDWVRITTEQTFSSNDTRGVFVYYSTQAAGSQLAAYAGCDNFYDLAYISGKVTF